MRIKVLAACVVYFGVMTEASAQVEDLDMEFVKETLAFLQQAKVDMSGAADSFMSAVDEGRNYPTEHQCLGKLQLALASATVLANALPFSETLWFEDEWGPVARVRILFNGRRVHVEGYCDGKRLVGNRLPWGKGSTEPRQVASDSLDVVLGGIFLLEMQSMLEIIPSRTQLPSPVVSPAQPNNISPPIVPGSSLPDVAPR